MGLRAYQIGLADSIQTRITYWVAALSQIQHMRDAPLKAIQNFSSQQLEQFLENINANLERQSLRVELDYLCKRLQRKPMKGSLPEQKLLGKRTLVFEIGFLVPFNC
jgi:hypothetical protein